MKSLTIRRWLLLSWVGTGFITFLLFGIVFRFGGSFHDDSSQQTLDTAQQEIGSNVSQWQDPQWQNNFKAKIDPLKVKVIIKDANNQEIYRLGNTSYFEQPSEKIVVTNGTQTVGMVSLFETSDYASRAITIGLLVLLTQFVALSLIGLFIGRTLLKPLAAMSKAASQIAGGDLNFTLPTSRRVREVAEVSAAFDAMGKALGGALERQAQLEQERRLFISAIAHDLRTPLFSLRGYLQGLERGLATTPEKRARYISLCQEKATLLEKRIADLFSYARVEYLGQVSTCDRFDFSLIVQTVIETLQPQIQAKNIEVALNGPQKACCLEGDEQLVTRALENLLDNAIRYAPSNGRVEVSWSIESSKLNFKVADNGPGIASQDLPHLFTPLYRADPSRSPQTGGAGLGLTIAQRILQSHGGSLEAYNRSIGGAEFVGCLPLISKAL